MSTLYEEWDRERLIQERFLRMLQQEDYSLPRRKDAEDLLRVLSSIPSPTWIGEPMTRLRVKVTLFLGNREINPFLALANTDYAFNNEARVERRTDIDVGPLVKSLLDFILHFPHQVRFDVDTPFPLLNTLIPACAAEGVPLDMVATLRASLLDHLQDEPQRHRLSQRRTNSGSTLYSTLGLVSLHWPDPELVKTEYAVWCSWPSLRRPRRKISRRFIELYAAARREILEGEGQRHPDDAR